MTHTGDMNYFLAILVAGLGGFTGDQIYFYIGRFNKGFIQRKLHTQRRNLRWRICCSKIRLAVNFCPTLYVRFAYRYPDGNWDYQIPCKDSR